MGAPIRAAKLIANLAMMIVAIIMSISNLPYKISLIKLRSVVVNSATLSALVSAQQSATAHPNDTTLKPILIFCISTPPVSVPVYQDTSSLQCHTTQLGTYTSMFRKP